jgi:FG-GAP repeat
MVGRGRGFRAWCLPVTVAMLAGLIGPAGTAVAAVRTVALVSPQQAEITSADGVADDQFGWSEAVSGSTMVVGTPIRSVGSNMSQGVVYVFSDTTGSWQQTAELTAPDGGQQDKFGWAVAVSGSTIAVSAPNHGPITAAGAEGAAYIFSDTSGTWKQTAELTVDDGTSNDLFGLSIGVSGQTVVVGAPNHQVGSGGFFQGVAYVFSDSGGSWQQTAELTGSDSMLQESFGQSVAIDGSTIVAGAYRARFDDPPKTIGSAYVFAETAGTWSQTAELAPDDAAAGDSFGTSVAVSGGTAVVGAPFHETGGNTAQGAAYVFTKAVSGGWPQAAELRAGDGAAGDKFGTSVAVSGSTVVAGSPNRTVGANATQGTAYAFSDVPGDWEQTDELVASDGGANDALGNSVAVSGATIAAGARYHTVGTHNFQGVVDTFGGGSTISVGVHLTNGKSTLALGASAPVDVTITAGDGNSGDISDLAWGSATPGGLGITPTGAASVTSALTPSLPSTLSPGQSVVLHGTIKAGTKPATATLTTTVTGQDGDGQPVTDTGHAQFVVGTKALTLSVATTPGEIHLDVNDDGKITPKKVTAAVTFTNTTSKPLTGVKLIGLQPSPQDPTQQLDQLAFAKGAIPVDVATIAANKSVVKKFPLEVTGDGTYVIRATAIFADPTATGGNGRATVEGGAFTVVVPFYFFKASIDTSSVSARGSSNWVRGGDPWFVKGTVKNLSSYQSLCLPPLVASTTGNADAVGLQDIATSDVTSTDPPLVGLIKPGASYSLLMLVTTSGLGATRGEVTLPTEVFKAVPGSSCDVQDDGTMSGAGARLTTAQTHIVGGSTDFTTHVDVSVNDDTTYASNAIAFFGGFAKGTLIGFANFAHGIFEIMQQCQASIPAYTNLTQATLGDPIAVSNVLARMNARVQVMTDLAAHYLETATPAEKEQVGSQVKSAFRRAGGDAYASVVAKYDAVSAAWFGDIIAAAKTGNADDEWRAWGEANGNFDTSIILQVLVAVMGKKIGGEIPALEERSAAATAESTELKTVKGGSAVAGRIVTLPEEERVIGVTAEQDASLGAIAKRFGILIGVRSRQAISVALEKLGAVWKSSKFHQKTINPLDISYMNFPEEDKGLLGFRSFTPAGKEAVERKIIFSDATTAERKELFGRLDGRIGENGPDYQKMLSMLNTKRNGVYGWTNAGFNATESGRATSSVARWRRFAVRETVLRDENGVNLGTYYKPYQENINYRPGTGFPPLCTDLIIKGIVMCPITGDLDLSYITTLYGNGLSSSLMTDVFAALEKSGFAHTDLVTWADQQTGAAMFPGKIKQLKDIAPGGEAVLQFAPDDVRRLTYLDLAKSIITGSNDYQLAIQGTYVPGMKP